jgi:hypothetical protein
VALNGDDEYSGGRLVFATAAGFEVPTRAAGSATIHTHGVVHGVTSLTSGVRYSLFVCDAVAEPLLGSVLSPTAVDLTYLEEAVANQLAFFASVMPLVDTCTDHQTSAYIEEYRSGFASGEPIAAAAAVSLGAVLAWRVHMLHPVAYLHARATAADTVAATSVVQWAGIDLGAAIRRQAKFMRQVLGIRSTIESAGVVAAAVREYRQFLELAQSTDTLAPTVLVDLVWHTHQQHSEWYARECTAIAGRLLDHDDDVNQAELDQASHDGRVVEHRVWTTDAGVIGHSFL